MNVCIESLNSKLFTRKATPHGKEQKEERKEGKEEEKKGGKEGEWEESKLSIILVSLAFFFTEQKTEAH